MSTGDVINPKRVRLQANERLDQIDADALSFAAREHIDAYTRAVETVPRNVGATTPTGVILQGFGLTLNPTAPSDGKVRVQSALGVAIDSNGRFLIKESGTQVDLTLPSGNSQVYAYYIEGGSDTTVRRAITVSSPFGEGPSSIPTKLQGGVAYFVRAGDQTSIVASDVVNGLTTALCFLGVANNTSGTVTMTGYNATTAPNGAFATNRISSVVAPTTPASTNTMSGSLVTMHSLISAALYAVGQALWKGSRNTPPTAANNFQAFAIPNGPGLDALFDSAAEGTTTPTTVYRDWNLKRRSTVDHNGYRMGQVTEADERWNVPTTRAWCYNVIANAKATGTGGGYVVATPFFGGIQFTASGQNFQMLITPQTHGSFSIVSAAASINRSNGTDSVAVGVEISTPAPTAASPTGVHGLTFTQATSSSGTGDVILDLAVVGGVAGGVSDYVVSSNTTMAINAATVGTPSGTNTLYAVSLTVVVDPPGWAYVPDFVVLATGLPAPIVKRAFDGPSVNINQASFRFAVAAFTTPAAGIGRMVTEQYECFLNADVAYVQEWMMRTGTIAGGANIRTFALGVQSNNAAAENRFIYFFNQNTTTNWQLRVVGSATTDNDTGVAIAANTTYRMRLEILGANVSTAGASSFRIRGYINGVKVVDVIDATFPVADMIRPYFHAGCTAAGATAAYGYNVGRVRRAWNHLLDGDNL